jgi:hypothetical protein
MNGKIAERHVKKCQLLPHLVLCTKLGIEIVEHTMDLRDQNSHLGQKC